MTPASVVTDDEAERVARALEPEAWERLNTDRDLIKHSITRSRSLRYARAALAASDRDVLVAENERLREAGEALSNFAWSLVSTDCDESRAYLQSLVDNLRAALIPLGGE